MTLEEIYKQLAGNVATAGGIGDTRRAAGYWTHSAEPSILPTQWGVDIATSPDLAGYITGIRDDRFTRAEIDDARTAATKAEHARILAKLEECRPTEQPYSRIQWRWEEKGRREQFDKMMKAVDQPTAWTKEPTETGAYWFQIPGCGPDIVWVHNGMVTDVISRQKTTVADDVSMGGFFFGPLHAPSPPAGQPVKEGE